ncbi:MAG TPA: rod shape-determining protein MreC [Burkholderiales bacterium]|nr:rod shape-determining protein MreC [Burkholderiales bacterium]
MEHAPPPFFKHGPSPLARLLLCSLLSVALLISDAHYRYLGGARQVIAFALYPLQRLADTPGELAAHLGEFLATRGMLRAENAQLTDRHLHDAAALQKYRALELENAQLRGLLEMRAHLPGGATAAEIAYAERDPFIRRVVIDKGALRGIRAGQPVIDQAGLIGQVTRVYPWLAEVTLVTDKQHMVSVQNLRNGLRAVLAGHGADGQLELRFIPLNADFQIGDQLATSGIDGVYPPGLPVAAIAGVERNPADLFARILCKPLAGVANHAQVLVLDWANTTPPLPEQPPPPAKKAGKGKP